MLSLVGEAAVIGCIKRRLSLELLSEVALRILIQNCDCLFDELLEDHVTDVDLDLGLLKLVVEPLWLRLNHLTSKKLHQFLLSDLGEQLLVKLTLVNELPTWQRTRQVYSPAELKDTKD